jgi:hypothetical protein
MSAVALRLADAAEPRESVVDYYVVPQTSSASAASVRVHVMSSAIGTDSAGPWAKAASPGPYCTVGM